MTTVADTGDGATFGVANTTAGPFTSVGEVTNISLPEEATDAVEATHLGSGGDREFIVGLTDGGEFGVEFNFTQGGYSALRARLKTKFAVQAEEPNGDTWGGAVIMTALKAGDLVAGEVTKGSAAFKVSGTLDYTEAS
ncbi:MAG: hypothetical protein ACT6TH_15275 [Brevundimonas sp.]|uniref:hypothetical protein n=1 Tax=Brevundimonas sp. TaxID=1871086 RepID=UPI004034A839